VSSAYMTVPKSIRGSASPSRTSNPMADITSGSRWASPSMAAISRLRASPSGSHRLALARPVCRGRIKASLLRTSTER
jgi:hypothetical protein